MTDLFWHADPGADPAVVLLHEGAGAGAVWQGRLDSHRQLITYDRRGYGSSPRDVDLTDRHFDQAAEDLAQLIGAATHAPVDLVGHSDGGSVALLLAARRPSLVRSVVVVATHVCADPATRSAVQAMGAPSDWDDRARRRYEALHGVDWEEVVSRWLHLWTVGGLASWDMRGALPEVAVPVLVVHDRADPLSPTLHAEAIDSLVPSAQVRWYDTGSHRPHLVAADRFRSDVHSFWGSVEA